MPRETAAGTWAVGASGLRSCQDGSLDSVLHALGAQVLPQLSS